MPALKGTLKERLSRYHQIKISVIGRNSGQTILIPMRRLSMRIAPPICPEERGCDPVRNTPQTLKK